MPSAKLAAVSALAVISLAACGTTAKPEAGTLRADARAHKGVDDPRIKHLLCLRADKLPVVTVGPTGLTIGTAPADAKVVFLPTPGSAQQAQIGGTDPGAEVIGSALLFPQRDSDAQLKQIEDCLATGVKG
jgi:ABC-type sugar transport system substrate-binding protein